MKRVYIIVIVLVLAGGILAAVLITRQINKSHPDYETLAPEYELSAADLFFEFKSDRATAEQKYNGSMVTISGKVRRVENVDTLSIAVFVFEKGMFGEEGIRCTMLGKENAHKVKSIVRNRFIDIKGFCTGFNDTDIILEKCTFIGYTKKE